LYARVGDIQPLEALRRTYDDDDAFWLEVSELLQLIREAGDIPASPSRLHLLLHGDDAATRSFRGRLPSGFERRVARAAEEVAYMAVEAGFAYDPEDDSDEYRDEDAWAVPQLVDEIYETVSQAATEAAHGWLDAALHDVEAVFWGEQLPLWEASVIFCGDELRMFPPSA